MVVPIVYELVVYPLIRNRLPSIIKRIGIISLLVFIFNCIQLLETILVHTHIIVYPSSWYSLIYSVPLCCTFVFLLTTLLEFVCAQSPYKMRGLLLGYAVLVNIFSLVINTITGIYISQNCVIILRPVLTTLSLIGFVGYCLLARWYKMRERDEEYDVHRVVEEVYDRYLSQRPFN